MGRPNEIALGFNEQGPYLTTRSQNRVSDLIWEAAEEAQLANWTADRFKRELRQAWEYYRNLQTKEDDKTLSK
jgi:hypothetical protein